MEKNGRCKSKAKYRLTWPGDDERVVCEQHAQQFAGIAKAMGLHLQIILLSETEIDLDCMQPEDKP